MYKETNDILFDILNETNTLELSLDTEVPGIGFTRKFRNCFDLFYFL